MTFWNFFFLIMIFIPLTMLWVFTLVDLAHRRDLSGLARGLWAVAVVFLPLLGMFVYFITRPEDVPTGGSVVAGSDQPSPKMTHEQLDEIEKLAALRDSGALSDEEFATMKSRMLD